MIKVKVREREGRSLQLWYNDPYSGKIVTKSSRTHDWGDAYKAAIAWEEELNAGEAGQHMAWDRFREMFVHEHNVSPKTHENVRTALNHLERLCGKPRFIGQVDSALISRFAAMLRAEQRPETTIGAYLGHVRSALGWAKDVGILEKVPRFPKKAVKGRRLMRGRPLRDNEFVVLMRCVAAIRPQDGRSWRHLLRGLWLSGLRLSEALKLTWHPSPFCVDSSGERVRIKIHGEQQKSRRDQMLPIAPEFSRYLDSFREEKGLVFPMVSRKGLQQNQKAVGRTLGEIGALSEIVVNENGSTVTAHDLRRSFGTRWARKVKPLTLKTLMRHSSIETTMRYYVELDVEDAESEIWAADG